MYRVVAGLSLITGVVLIAKPPILFGSDSQHYDAIGELPRIIDKWILAGSNNIS